MRIFKIYSNLRQAILKESGFIPRPPIYDQEEWDSLDPSEQSARRYFWVGQDNDDEVKNNYCWLWHNNRLLVAKGGTHSANFGYALVNDAFRGWLDVDKNILSFLFPNTVEWEKASHDVQFIPRNILRALYKRFGRNFKIETF